MKTSKKKARKQSAPDQPSYADAQRLIDEYARLSPRARSVVSEIISRLLPQGR